MIFYENRLLADDSHVIPYLVYIKNLERCRLRVSANTDAKKCLPVQYAGPRRVYGFP